MCPKRLFWVSALACQGSHTLATNPQHEWKLAVMRIIGRVIDELCKQTHQSIVAKVQESNGYYAGANGNFVVNAMNSRLQQIIEKMELETKRSCL